MWSANQSLQNLQFWPSIGEVSHTLNKTVALFVIVNKSRFFISARCNCHCLHIYLFLISVSHSQYIIQYQISPVEWKETVPNSQ